MSAPELISREALVSWKGTNAALARSLGVTRAAIFLARIRHGVPMPRKGLGKTVVKAVVAEAKRRRCTVRQVVTDLGEIAEVKHDG